MASISNDDTLLKARVEDAVRLCERRSSPVFIGFLDERQQAMAKRMLRPFAGICVRFWGGHPEGERTLLGVSPAFLPLQDEWFPVTAMAFHYRREAGISHRDVMGSLLSLGVRREMLGDILCAPGLSVAFVKEEIVPFLNEQVVKIGGEGVRVESPFYGELPQAHTFREWRDTVASLRLDAVLKVCLFTSREEAARRIEAGLVSVNHLPCTSVCADVHEGDVFSVRGSGRFRLREVGSLTRKGRVCITVQQYL